MDATLRRRTGSLRTMKRILPFFLALTLTTFLRAADQPIDWERAKELYQRSQSGGTLTADEQKYLDEAKRQREAQQGGGPGAPSSPDREKMRAIKEKMDRGETLTSDEQKLVEEMRKRMASGGQPGGGEFTWDKARAAHEKEQRGEALSDDEKKLLAEARKRFEEGRGPDKDAGAPQRPKGEAPPPLAPPPKDLVPLNELTAKYKDQDGGLYGGGKNEPPAEHAALARKAIAEIKPLDRDGKPATDGKVVLMSIGMSNTTMEFSAFVQSANADSRKAAHVVVVDAAQGGKDATAWATADAQPWKVAAQKLEGAGVSPAQVQAVWIKQALMGPRAGFPSETERLRDRDREIVLLAKQKYPNLRVAYLSSRIYAGYATTALNPEPYSYESAFAVRWLIEEQMKGTPALNADAAKGEVKAPVLLWGPYLWTNGETPRKSDGLVFKREDLTERDGTHPSNSGREKVAKLLLDFFTGDPLAKTWFAK